GSTCSTMMWTLRVACSELTFPAVAARPRTSMVGSSSARETAKAPSMPGSETKTTLRIMAAEGWWSSRSNAGRHHLPPLSPLGRGEKSGGSLLLDAIQVPVAAQQQLLADRNRRGVDGIVKLVRCQDLELVRVPEHQRRALAINDVDTVLRPGGRCVQAAQARQPL